MISKRIDAKVYLEGIKMPFNRITLSMGPNRTNTLILELPPVKGLFDIVPRTFVQVFYNDGEGFRTFFEGEVIAHGFTKTAQGGRNMVLTCADMSNYWTYSYGSYITKASIEQFALVDELRVFTGAEARQAPQKTENERVFVVRGIGGEARQKLRQQDVVTGVKEAMELVEKVNDFYQDRFDRFKIKDRFKVLPDGQIKFLFDARLVDVIDFVKDNQNVYMPIINIFSVVLQQAFQNFWSLSLPGVQAGAPVNFTIVPATFVTAPPRCNVIFPDLHDGFAYERNMLAEPTRLKVFTGGSSDFIPSPFFYAPADFRERILPAIRTAQGKNEDVRDENLLVESTNPELDETIRGIIPSFLSLQQDTYFSVRRAVFAAAKDQKAGEEAARTLIERTLAQIADFELLLRKFQPRTISISLPFNPNLHPAFPVLLLDKEAHVFGNPVGLTHAIDGAGNASTSLSCTYARHRDVLVDVLAEIPPWFNRSFDPKAIGTDLFTFQDAEGKTKTVEGAYPSLVDVQMGSILSSTLPVFENAIQVDDKVPETQEAAAQSLFDLYRNVGDRETFVTEFTRRRIQTFEEHLEFLGLSELNEDLLEGPLYDASKRNLISDVKARLVETNQAFSELTFDPAPTTTEV